MNPIALLRNISKVALVCSIIIIIISYNSFFSELKNPETSNKTLEETSLLKKSRFMLIGNILLAICGLVELITR